jgi:hypothetical protein
MALEKFDLASLTELDGARIRTAFDQAVARLTEDCKDRPNVKARRSVTLMVSLVPVPNDEGDLGSVDVDFQLKESMPKRESRTYNMLPTRSGLLVNEASPDEVKQMTLDEVGKPRARKQSAEEVADAV